MIIITISHFTSLGAAAGMHCESMRTDAEANVHKQGHTYTSRGTRTQVEAHVHK